MKQELKALGLGLMLIGLLWAGMAWAEQIGVVETAEMLSSDVDSTINFRAPDNDSPTFETWTFATTNHFGAYSSRGAAGTAAAPLIVQDGGMLQVFQSMAYDGSNYYVVASIRSSIDGTPGTTDLPTKWIFSVTPDGSQNEVEAFRISNDKSADFADDVTAVGDVSSVNAFVATYDAHTGDTDTNRTFADDEITFSAGGQDMLKMIEGANDYVIVDPNVTGAVFLGIGTTTPDYALDVAANHASGYAASFFNDGATSTSLGIKIQCGEDGSAGSILVDFYHGGGGLLGNISDNYGLGFDQLSDKKVKSNIRPSERDAIDKVRKLGWYAYDIDGRHIDGGLVAQRVEDVLPDAVTTRTFTSAAGEKSVMMIHGAPVEKVYQQAVTQMAIEQNLQRRQIDYLKAQAIKAGWDMSKFPLQ